MRRLPKPLYLTTILAVSFVAAAVAWLWVTTEHSGQMKRGFNDTVYLSKVTGASTASGPSDKEAGQVEAERLANWKEKFPWKPTHDPLLIFDASQPYNYLLTYDVSKVTQEENIRIHRLWDWLRSRFTTEAGKAEMESLINRLVVEIPDMDDLPKNIMVIP